MYAKRKFWSSLAACGFTQDMKINVGFITELEEKSQTISIPAEMIPHYSTTRYFLNDPRGLRIYQRILKSRDRLVRSSRFIVSPSMMPWT